MYVNVPWTDANTDTITSVGVSGSETTGTITLTAAGATTLTQSGQTVEIRSTDTTYTVGDGGLSQKNFTTTLKTKLDGIATGANNVTNNNQLTNGAGYVTASNHNHDGSYLDRYTGSASGVDNTGFTTAFTVNGGNLASSIRFSVQGTTGSVVVSNLIDVTVNHYQDIMIEALSGVYTELTVKVISNNNEDFAVELKTNSANAVTLAIEVFAYGDEDVSFVSSHGYTGASITHALPPGKSLFGGGGDAGDFKANGTLQASGYNDANWNTAYGWGNHASAGYSTASGVADNANNYSLPAGSSSTRGGFKIGYSENGKNYPVEVSSEKMYVNVPWTDANTNYYLNGITKSGNTLTFAVNGATNQTYTFGSNAFNSTAYSTASGVADNADVTPSWIPATNPNYLTSIPTTLSGNRTIGGDLTVSGNQVITTGSNADVKFSVWSGTTYGIGMTSGVTYGGLNDYAMTFCMNDDSDRGFWWGYSGQTKSAGAMSLTTSGNLTLAGNASISGTISASGYNDANWNTAYGWGNHASGGYSTASGVEDNADVTDTTNVVAALTAGTNVQIAANGTISATDTNTVYTHPTSAGNKHIPSGGSAGQFLKYSSSGTATWATPSYTTNTNTQLSNEQVQDIVGAMFSGNSESNITATYQDGDGTIDLAVAANYGSWDLVADDDTTFRVDSTEHVKFQGANISGTGTQADPFLVNTADTNTTYSADGNYGMTLSGTAFRLEDDRRRNATTADIYTGNTHDYTFYDASHGIRWYTAGSEEMRLEDDGDLHVDGDVIAFSTTVSDQRLKDDVQTIENASEKVSKLRGVEYTWNEGSRKGQREIGVIAQEVEAVVPEIVHEKKLPFVGDETYKTVDYEKLVALLIESNKELLARVETLESKLDGTTK
jgi:hypothetical protein